MAPRRAWMELDGIFRLRPTQVRPWQIAILAFGLILLMAWAMWDQKRLIAGQQDEIQGLQEHIRHLEERLGILNDIWSYRPSLPHWEATAMARAIQQEARRYDLDWQLLLAIIRVESGFNPRAESHRGAIGLMQVRPAAFAEVVTDLGWRDSAPEQLRDLGVNVRVGAHYLFRLVGRFGNIDKAVQAYYLGPSRIANPSDRWARLSQRYLGAIALGQNAPCCTRSRKAWDPPPDSRQARWGGGGP